MARSLRISAEAGGVGVGGERPLAAEVGVQDA